MFISCSNDWNKRVSVSAILARLLLKKIEMLMTFPHRSASTYPSFHWARGGVLSLTPIRNWESPINPKHMSGFGLNPRSCEATVLPLHRSSTCVQLLPCSWPACQKSAKPPPTVQRVGPKWSSDDITLGFNKIVFTFYTFQFWSQVPSCLNYTTGTTS